MNSLKTTLKVFLIGTLAIIAACILLYAISPGLAFGMAIHGGLPLLIILYCTFAGACALFAIYKVLRLVFRTK